MTQFLNQNSISGECQAQFEPIREALLNSFVEYGDRGAGLCVFHRGEKVVDLWAGTTNRDETEIWQQDTVVNVFSAGKAFVAVCVLRLLEQGALQLDEPVATYWPEFAANGKAAITVAQVLSHTSGVSAFQRKQQDDVIYHWEDAVAEIETAEPWWEPGSAQGYSPMLFGWLAGELVRRVAATDSFNEAFQQLVAEPLGIDAWFGVPDSVLPRISDVGPLRVPAPADAIPNLMSVMSADRGGVAEKAFTNPMSIMTGTNSVAWRQAQIPGGNGCTNARGLAVFYNALLQSNVLLNDKTRSLLWQQLSHSKSDNTLGTELSFSHGFMLSDGRPECQFGRGARGFGHPGAGGSLAFADPDNELSFGYTTNRLGQSVLLDRRAIALIDRVYEVIGV